MKNNYTLPEAKTAKYLLNIFPDKTAAHRKNIGLANLGIDYAMQTLSPMLGMVERDLIISKDILSSLKETEIILNAIQSINESLSELQKLKR